MFSMNELQSKLAILKNEIRQAGRDISTTILTGQDETDRAGALLHERLTQCDLDEAEEIARHGDAMSAIRNRRESALADYGMALKAVETRIRILGNNLLESREPVKVIRGSKE